jgi:hypothetical protein
MRKEYRLAVALSMCIPANNGLKKLDRAVDTIILGDSVARINISSAQWHTLGLGDVINLGNSSVKGIKADVATLSNYLAKFRYPKTVVMIRHLGAYRENSITSNLIRLLSILATGQLILNGKWPKRPIINDNRQIGLPADPQLVHDFVKLKPKWLVGPWELAEENEAMLVLLRDICDINHIKFRVVVGPTCNLVIPEATKMKQELIKVCNRLDIKLIHDTGIYEPEDMQDPNHLRPEIAYQWSEKIAKAVK